MSVSVPSEFADLCSKWYDGSRSMMYAIASTGDLTRGSIRPIGDEGPMTDYEWERSLWSRLETEIRDLLKMLRSDSDEACDLREFQKWVEGVLEDMKEPDYDFDNHCQ